MSTQHAQLAVPILSLGGVSLAGLLLCAQPAGPGGGEIVTPAEITIHSTPAGPVFADPQGYSLYVTGAGHRARNVHVRRPLHCGVAPGQDLGRRHAVRGLDARPAGRRRIAVGLSGTAAVPVSPRSEDWLGRGAEPRVALSNYVPVSRQGNAASVRPAQ